MIKPDVAEEIRARCSSKKITPQPEDSVAEKIAKMKKNTRVRAYIIGEASEDCSKKAYYIDKKTPKDEEDEETIRQLRDESVRLNQEAQFFHAMSESLGLGEKILAGFFGAQILIASAGKLKESPYFYNMVKPVQELSHNGQMMTALESRAIAIEQMCASLEHINSAAIDKGIIDVDRPIFSKDDAAKFHHLAELMRDPNTTPEIYGAACKDLGLDYNEAKEFFEREKSAVLQKNVEQSNDKILQKVQEARNLKSGGISVGFGGDDPDKKSGISQSAEKDQASLVYVKEKGANGWTKDPLYMTETGKDAQLWEKTKDAAAGLEIEL